MAIVKGTLVQYNHKDGYAPMRGQGICASAPWTETPNCEVVHLGGPYIGSAFFSPKDGRRLIGSRQRIKVYWIKENKVTIEYSIFLMRITLKGVKSRELRHAGYLERKQQYDETFRTIRQNCTEQSQSEG